MRVNKCEEEMVKYINGFLIIIEGKTRISQKEEMKIRKGGKKIKMWDDKSLLRIDVLTVRMVRSLAASPA